MAMRVPPALPVILLSLTAWAGCQTGGISAVIPVSGGGTITVPIGPKGTPKAESDGYRVDLAALKPATEPRQAYYDFSLFLTAKSAPKRIRITDISDEKPAVLVDDAQPQVTNGKWETKTENLVAEDPRLAWIFQITHSYRVYRFSITQADGREVTMDQVVPYPPFIKEAIRTKWGEKY